METSSTTTVYDGSVMAKCVGDLRKEILPFLVMIRIVCEFVTKMNSDECKYEFMLAANCLFVYFFQFFQLLNVFNDKYYYFQ